jgi:hypothetical protein
MHVVTASNHQSRMSLRGRLKKQLIHIHNRDRGKKTAEDDTNFTYYNLQNN